MDTYFSLWPLRCMLGFLIWVSASANSSTPSNSDQSMPVGRGQSHAMSDVERESGKK
jgi:hypothetical protein